MVPHDVQTMLERALKPEESFKFRCLQCGSCCRNREDILLNPYDLHRIARELHMKTNDIVMKYCITYIGESSKLPCVLLKPKGDQKICPLLKKGKCSVHRNKPTVCALFPLGRGIKLDKPGSTMQRERIVYFKQDIGCGARDEEHTVAEWLEEFNLQESEAWFLVWSKTIAELTMRIGKIEPKVSDAIMDELYSAIFIKLYLDYPDGEDFVERFKSNAAQVNGFLDIIMQKSRR